MINVMDNDSPKVSMVIPCYNKKEYIAEMLDSVLNQVYNNIELILVDDGSTDGTEQIIRDYVPMFLARGFEFVIIRQRNQGLSAAIRNGLMRVTGEYICFPDCDDILTPDYASFMAGYLNEHPECEAVRCRADFDNYHNYIYDLDYFKGVLLGRSPIWVWVMLIRTSLLERIPFIDNFITSAEFKCQEPQVAIPIAYFAKNFIFIDHFVYIYRRIEGLDSKTRESIELSSRFSRLYYETMLKTLKLYGIPKIYDLYAEIFYYFYRFDRELDTKEEFYLNLRSLADKLSFPADGNNDGFYYKLTDYLLDVAHIVKHDFVSSISGRVIFYGVLGKSYKNRCEHFINSRVWADIMIDAGAGENTTLEEQQVLTPEEYIPKRNDTIVVFPISPEIIDNVKSAYANTIVNIRVISAKDIITFEVVKNALPNAHP